MASYFGKLEPSNSLHTASYCIAGVARHCTDLLFTCVTGKFLNHRVYVILS